MFGLIITRNCAASIKSICLELDIRLSSYVCTIAVIEQPTHREVMWVVGQRGGKVKTFLQNYIKYYYSDRRVISTDMATNAKNLTYFLTKISLACKDIFLFNHPYSKTESIAYDLFEGIKDGYKGSAKYVTNSLIFKAPNTVIVFSNEHPRTEAIGRDWWRVYEIIEEDLCNKPALATKSWLCYQSP